MSELNLGESIDISRVGIAYAELKNSLETSSKVNLNLRDISHIDGAGIQLLYAYITAAKKKGLDISMSEPSASVRSAAESLGLDKLIGFAS
ncbi:MAG: STAS domain-containing protein [Gammaproteobacteria bacterium]|nr:STAS domain-containing protein [Gammaproteobacteria bacterium]